MSDAVNRQYDCSASGAQAYLETTQASDLENELHLADPFTISFWVKSTHAADNPFEFFFTKVTDPSLGGPGIQAYQDGGVLTCEYITDWTSSDWIQVNSGDHTGALADRNWHMVTFTYHGIPGTIPKIYVDGVEDFNTTTTGTLSNASNNTTELFMIGGRADVHPTNAFNGKMNDFTVWQGGDFGALSTAEIVELHNEGEPTDLINHSRVQDLVSWWRLGDDPDDLASPGRVYDMHYTNDIDMVPLDTTVYSPGRDVPHKTGVPYYFIVQFKEESYDGDCSTTPGTNYYDCSNSHGHSDWTGYADTGFGSYYYGNNARVRLLDEHGAPINAMLNFDFTGNNYAYGIDRLGKKYTLASPFQPKGFGGFGFNTFGSWSNQELEIVANLTPGTYYVEVTSQTMNMAGGDIANIIIFDGSMGSGNLIYPVQGSDDDTSGGMASSNWSYTAEYAKEYYRNNGTAYSGQIAPSLSLRPNNQWAHYPADSNEPKIYHKIVIV
jgi:hypothetical protein